MRDALEVDASDFRLEISRESEALWSQCRDCDSLRLRVESAEVTVQIGPLLGGSVNSETCPWKPNERTRRLIPLLIERRIELGKVRTAIFAKHLTAEEFETLYPGVLKLRDPESWRPLYVELRRDEK